MFLTWWLQAPGPWGSSETLRQPRKPGATTGLPPAGGSAVLILGVPGRPRSHQPAEPEKSEVQAGLGTTQDKAGGEPAHGLTLHDGPGPCPGSPVGIRPCERAHADGRAVHKSQGRWQWKRQDSQGTAERKETVPDKESSVSPERWEVELNTRRARCDRCRPSASRARPLTRPPMEVGSALWLWRLG